MFHIPANMLKSENLKGHKADFCRQYCLMLVFKEAWWILRGFFPSINQRGYGKGDLFLFFSTADCAFEGLSEYLLKKVLITYLFRSLEGKNILFWQV